MAGHSAKPLIEKLGYAAGESVATVNEPAWFDTLLKEHGVANSRKLPATHAHIFSDNKAELIALIENLALEDIQKSLWISWPKAASGVYTDLTEQDLRDSILPLGWVDTKVCAVDETWSGLKFLRRKK